jgi:hypothetical protein
MNNKTVALWRDIEELKIWDENKYGMRFIRDSQDKTRYKSYFTDDEINKLESFVRKQQAEIESLKQIIDANNLNQNIGQFVKPTNEPKPDVVRYAVVSGTMICQQDFHNVRAIFDGETGELKSVEMIK